MVTSRHIRTIGGSLKRNEKSMCGAASLSQEWKHGVTSLQAGDHVSLRYDNIDRHLVMVFARPGGEKGPRLLLSQLGSRMEDDELWSGRDDNKLLFPFEESQVLINLIGLVTGLAPTLVPAGSPTTLLYEMRPTKPNFTALVVGDTLSLKEEKSQLVLRLPRSLLPLRAEDVFFPPGFDDGHQVLDLVSAVTGLLVMPYRPDLNLFICRARNPI